MLWFYKMEQKYGKYAIRNLTWYLIICYAIEHSKYNLVEINCMLFEHDQSLLGS